MTEIESAGNPPVSIIVAKHHQRILGAADLAIFK
jgi:hypothetical protein